MKFNQLLVTAARSLRKRHGTVPPFELWVEVYSPYSAEWLRRPFFTEMARLDEWLAANPHRISRFGGMRRFL